MDTAVNNTQWSYTDFVFTEWGDGVWTSSITQENVLTPLARQYFWETYQTRILAELNEWQQHGWSLAEKAGPEAITLTRAERRDSDVDPSEILVWIMTLGIALVLRLLTGFSQTYVDYKPLECRIRMCRPSDD